ncbi:hypothetical protein HYPSUDRAFT_88550, partial [Hypholoma sublateritium FD-334 SS-4]
MYNFRRGAFIALSLYFLIRIRMSIRTNSERFKETVDSILDRKVSDFLPRIHTAPGDDLQRILDLQLYLSCLIKNGKWTIDSQLWPSFSLAKACSHSNVHSRFSDLASTADLCYFLSGKKILFIGPETTYYLHSLWLASLETYERRSHTCLGHEFCTFHHICRLSTVSGELPLEGLTDGRKKKMPSNNMLMTLKSSLFQYTFSTTLDASENNHDRLYTKPVVDEQTAIRVPNTYWLRRARKADVIVINRGPVPSPATTYAFSSEKSGNWTFTRNICAQNNHLGSSPCNATLETLLVNAALHVTVNYYLPSLFQSLQIISQDIEIARSSLVWQSSWYIQPICSLALLPNSVSLLEDTWSTENVGLVDPWTFYYNSQVYMHDRLLPKILPHFNITYIPLTMPTYLRPQLRLPQKEWDISAAHPKDCLRQPWPTFGAYSLEM